MPIPDMALNWMTYSWIHHDLGHMYPATNNGSFPVISFPPLCSQPAYPCPSPSLCSFRQIKTLSFKWIFSQFKVWEGFSMGDDSSPVGFSSTSSTYLQSRGREESSLCAVPWVPTGGQWGLPDSPGHESSLQGVLLTHTVKVCTSHHVPHGPLLPHLLVLSLPAYSSNAFLCPLTLNSMRKTSASLPFHPMTITKNCHIISH